MTRPGTAAPPPRRDAQAASRADAARRHVLALRANGGSYRTIASAAGLAAMTVRDLATSRATPRRHTAAAVLAVTPGALARTRADAGGTMLRLRALHVMGHGCTRIARAARTRPATIRKVVRGDARTVTARLRDAVIVVYDAWWDKTAPQAAPGARAAATRARRRAITGNWCAGAALDDDQLDVPGYQPAHGWKPARGTGTATSTLPPPPPGQQYRSAPGRPR